jgi:hypothetical protein
MKVVEPELMGVAPIAPPPPFPLQKPLKVFETTLTNREAMNDRITWEGRTAKGHDLRLIRWREGSWSAYYQIGGDCGPCQFQVISASSLISCCAELEALLSLWSPLALEHLTREVRDAAE